MALSEHMDRGGAVRPRGRHETRPARFLGLVLAGVTALATGCGGETSAAEREAAGGTAATAAGRAPDTSSAETSHPEHDEAAGAKPSEGGWCGPAARRR